MKGSEKGMREMGFYIKIRKNRGKQERGRGR